MSKSKEFTRPPKPLGQYALKKGGGPFVFIFLDADGVVLETVAPQVEGGVIPQAGARFRILLTMPDERTLAATRSIVVE